MGRPRTRSRTLERVARRFEDLPEDPILVLVDDEDAMLNFDEWLALIAADEPSAVDADAAALLRGIREHGER